MQLYVANTYRRHVVFSLALLAFSFSLIFFLPFFHSTVSFFIPSTPYFFLAFLFSLFFPFRIFLTFLLFKRAENFFATSGYPSTGPPSLPLLFPFFFPLLATFNYTTATIFTPLVHHAACFRERNIFCCATQAKTVRGGELCHCLRRRRRRCHHRQRQRHRRRHCRRRC